MLKKPFNIVLTGMPDSGKSTFGIIQKEVCEKIISLILT